MVYSAEYIKKKLEQEMILSQAFGRDLVKDSIYYIKYSELNNNIFCSFALWICVNTTVVHYSRLHYSHYSYCMRRILQLAVEATCWSDYAHCGDKVVLLQVKWLLLSLTEQGHHALWAGDSRPLSRCRHCCYPLLPAETSVPNTSLLLLLPTWWPS